MFTRPLLAWLEDERDRRNTQADHGPAISVSTLVREAVARSQQAVSRNTGRPTWQESVAKSRKPVKRGIKTLRERRWP